MSDPEYPEAGEFPATPDEEVPPDESDSGKGNDDAFDEAAKEIVEQARKQNR